MFLISKNISKEIAFRIHIEPLKTVEQAAKVETVIRVLSNIVKSYNNYLEVELYKNEGIKKVYKVLDTIRIESGKRSAKRKPF
jgi:hypothetical protein